MGWPQFWERIQKLWQLLFKRSGRNNSLLDTAKVNLWGLEIEVTRKLAKNIPYELTVVIPRVEYRFNRTTPGSSAGGWEVLLNSITVVHAPRWQRSEAASDSALKSKKTANGLAVEKHYAGPIDISTGWSG